MCDNASGITKFQSGTVHEIDFDNICNSNYSSGDCGQMSVGNAASGFGGSNDLEISPPPRAKRASLPRKSSPPLLSPQPQPPQPVVSAPHPKPDSSNIIRTKNETVAKKHLVMKRLPPKPPNNQRHHQKPIIEKPVRNTKNEHIYECIEFRQQSLPPGKNLANTIQNTLKSVSLGRYEAPLKSKGNTLLQVGQNCFSI